MKFPRLPRWWQGLFLSVLLYPIPAPAGESNVIRGYFRFPTLHGETLVFTAEGDLWRVSIAGGSAQRLTSHPGSETHAAFSPDGRWIAFSAQYEGPQEVYVMPADGGSPIRRTFDGGTAAVVGWSPEGQVLYSTRLQTGLPDTRLAVVDPTGPQGRVIPLAQASEGVFDPATGALFFTRLPFQGSSTKRYQGGTAQMLWKFPGEGHEAVPLTADYNGTSKDPMWWQGRIYFNSDRDGSMNLWSVRPDGSDLRPQTHHKDWDVKSPSLQAGRIVYQLRGDLRLYDIARNEDRPLTIRLTSDFDQQREKWVKQPADFLTSVHLSPTGDRVVLTARGQVFVAPLGPGRLVDVTHDEGARFRNARFLPDGKGLVALSDQTREMEFVKLPANGVGPAEPLSSDGHVFRFDGLPSPDGKWLAYTDKNFDFWVLNVAEKKSRLIDVGRRRGIHGVVWSPDSHWLAYVNAATNTFPQIWLHQTQGDGRALVTSDRVESLEPAFSRDGKWLYFISNRHLNSVVSSPWGLRQPEPFFDKMGRLYLIPLTAPDRSPFEPANETTETPKGDAAKGDNGRAKLKATSPKQAAESKSKDAGTNNPAPLTYDLAGLTARAMLVPIAPGNYEQLAVGAKHLFWIAREAGGEGKRTLMRLEISNNEPKPEVFADDIRDYELSQDGVKIFIHKGDKFHVEDATAGAPLKLQKTVDLKSWTFSLDPRTEWRQILIESWRMQRDYFYDRHMHGMDWPRLLEKYLPLVDRVTDRAELGDIISDLMGELSALHTYVRGGEQRETPENIKVAALGARVTRNDAAGGWRVEHIYRSDPEYPEELSPLGQPSLGIRDGDVIETINGLATLSVSHLSLLLRNTAGRQVLVGIKSGSKPVRQVIVTPITSEKEADLRYAEWEYTRRQTVEERGRGQIGYVHLRAMGADSMAEWTRDYFPVFDRQGLIIDVRHNRGGNIDSWILEKLLRKAWFFWQPRVGEPYWNMQYAFRGHLVVLCDEFTASDGEAFTEGFKRLGLGKVIGRRTWGGEIWLSANPWLVDKGFATAAEIGVFGPEGKWLIEGHGVEPDIEVDNLPHATFEGKDAQLERALEYLQEEIRKSPILPPKAPPHPVKAIQK